MKQYQASADGHFFTVAYNRDTWPFSAKGVTKSTLKELPE